MRYGTVCLKPVAVGFPALPKRGEETLSEISESQQGGHAAAEGATADEGGVDLLAEVRAGGEGAAEESGARGGGTEED